MKVTVWRPDTCGCTILYTWDETAPADQRVHTVVAAINAGKTGGFAVLPPGRDVAATHRTEACEHHLGLPAHGCSFDANGDVRCHTHQGARTCLAEIVVGENQAKNAAHASIAAHLPDRWHARDEWDEPLPDATRMGAVSFYYDADRRLHAVLHEAIAGEVRRAVSEAHPHIVVH